MTTESLFGASPTVGLPDNAEDTYTMGTRVTFGVAGSITGIRFWGASNAISTSPFGAVYSTGGALQASKAFSGFTPSAWNTVMLDTPFAVANGETWDIAVGPLNRYAANISTLPVTSGDLTGDAGRFVVGTSLAWPTTASGGGATWLGVDLLFDPTAGITGALATTAPVPVAVLAGVAATAGQLAAAGPRPVASLAGALSIPGVLGPATPLPVAAFAGSVAVDGGLNLALVMQAIADRLDTIPGLRAYGWPSRSIKPPAAIVTYPDEGIDYDFTYVRGADRIPNLPVVVVVGAADARSTRDRLGAYTNSAGVRSIKQVIESGDYGDVFDEVTVKHAGFDAMTIAGTEYMVALFDLDIVGSGGGR